jgi:hypothetical protein
MHLIHPQSMRPFFQRLLFFLLTLMVGYAGWWFGKSGTDRAELPKSAGVTHVGRPQLPAPAIKPLPPAAPVDAGLSKPEGPLARLMKNPETSLKLTAAQLSTYLSANRRNAESLLAAFRLAGDLAFLREAAQKFPDNATVQTELALRSTDENERRQAIDSMRRADPANALGDYLSALDHLRHGRSEQAFDDLIAGAGKSQFDDYSLNAMQSAEEAYLAAGFPPFEAKAAAMMGLPRKQLQPMLDLTRQLSELYQGYSASGDLVSAEAIRKMGQSLGRQMQDTAGFLIDELSGISIEKKFLDPTTAAVRQQEIIERMELIRRTAMGDDFTRLLQGMDTQEAIAYFDRVKLYGESAAMQWLRERHGSP